MSTPIEPPVHRSPAGPEPHAGHRTAPASVHRPLLRGLVAYLVIAAVIGGLAGLVWNGVTDLPTYTIGSDGSASITERGLASVISTHDPLLIARADRSVHLIDGAVEVLGSAG